MGQNNSTSTSNLAKSEESRVSSRFRELTIRRNPNREDYPENTSGNSTAHSTITRNRLSQICYAPSRFYPAVHYGSICFQRLKGESAGENQPEDGEDGREFRESAIPCNSFKIPLISVNGSAAVSCNYGFTARPIKPGTSFVVKIIASNFEPLPLIVLSEIGLKWQPQVGGFLIGFTSCDPSSMDALNLPKDPNSLLDRPEYWTINGDATLCAVTDDEFCFTFETSGEIKMSKNAGAESTLMHVDHSVPLWAFFTLYKPTSEICILGKVPRPLTLTGQSLSEAHHGIQSPESHASFNTNDSTECASESSRGQSQTADEQRRGRRHRHHNRRHRNRARSSDTPQGEGPPPLNSPGGDDEGEGEAPSVSSDRHFLNKIPRIRGKGRRSRGQGHHHHSESLTTANLSSTENTDAVFNNLHHLTESLRSQLHRPESSRGRRHGRRRRSRGHAGLPDQSENNTVSEAQPLPTPVSSNADLASEQLQQLNQPHAIPGIRGQSQGHSGMVHKRGRLHMRGFGGRARRRNQNEEPSSSSQTLAFPEKNQPPEKNEESTVPAQTEQEQNLGATTDSICGDSRTECMICCEREKDSIFLPCAHVCMCFECAQSYWGRQNPGADGQSLPGDESPNQKTCPICRSPADSFIRIFNA